jgi:four helix bundle protein
MYQDLTVWQRSMDLAVLVYQLTKKLPSDERFGIVDQLHRAVVSIPSNIAEGQGRGTKREFAHFLSIAMGSLAEVETQLLLCCRIGYLNEMLLQDAFALIEEIQKMITGLRRSIVDNNL